VIQIH